MKAEKLLDLATKVIYLAKSTLVKETEELDCNGARGMWEQRKELEEALR